LASSDRDSTFALNQAEAQSTLSFLSSQMKFFEGFDGACHNRDHIVTGTIGDGCH